MDSGRVHGRMEDFGYGGHQDAPADGKGAALPFLRAFATAVLLVVGFATQQPFGAEPDDTNAEESSAGGDDSRDFFEKPGPSVGYLIDDSLEYDLEHSEDLAEFFASATVESIKRYLASEQLLQQAARYAKDADLVRFLIESGLDVTKAYGAGIEAYPQDFGEPLRDGPLHFAARYNPNPRVVDVLVEAGADIHAVGGWGLSAPLHYAARHNNAAVASALLGHGARAAQVNGRISQSYSRSPNINGNTALHFAGENPDATVIDVLVEAGAQVHRRNGSGLMPLHFAVVAQNEAAVEALLRRHADPTLQVKLVNRADEIHHCTGCDAVELLVDSLYREEDSLYLEEDSLYAEEGTDAGRVERLLRMLIDAGADISAGAALRMAVERELDADIVALLIRLGARPDAGALHAVFSGVYRYSGKSAGGGLSDRSVGSANNVGVLGLLLAAGLDADAVNAADACGLTALHRAVSFGNGPDDGIVKAVEMLIAAGADVNAGKWIQDTFTRRQCGVQGSTPLHEAAMLRGEDGADVVIGRLLLEAGADRNARDPEGRTPLDAARSAGMKRLLSGGAEARGERE